MTYVCYSDTCNRVHLLLGIRVVGNAHCCTHLQSLTFAMMETSNLLHLLYCVLLIKSVCNSGICDDMDLL